MAVFFLAALGLIAGSTITALSPALSKNKAGSWLTGRSTCPACGATLKAQDLLPVLSYLALKGTCRYCKKSIGVWHVATEVATCIAFVVVGSFFWELGATAVGAVLAITFGLCLLAVHDSLYTDVPDCISLPLLALCLLASMVLPISFFHSLIGAALGGGAVVGIIAINEAVKKLRPQTQVWIGGGDIRLMAITGSLTAPVALLPAAAITVCVGAVVGLVLLRRGIAHVPMGGAWIVGTVLGWLWGEQLVHAYLAVSGFTV